MELRSSAHLVVVFIQHDDDLSHIVELSDGAQVVHGLPPLPVLLLLITHEGLDHTGIIFTTIHSPSPPANHNMHTTASYVQQAAVAEDVEQRVDVALAGEVEAGAHVAVR